MSQNPPPPVVSLIPSADYRENYANSVQVQMSVWDFRLTFGTAHQESEEKVTINAFEAIYLSPQQAKALWNVLGQNLVQYEQTFGQLSLDPKSPPPHAGPVH